MKITNRRAYHEYHILREFVAGLQLVGSEVKSLRAGNANISDAYCFIEDGEIFMKNAHISPYKDSSYMNHEERRNRKLLLRKTEIKAVHKAVQETGITIVPLEIFVLNGRLKAKIAVVKGKKLYDKREDLKKKDLQRELDRNI